MVSEPFSVDVRIAAVKVAALLFLATCRMSLKARTTVFLGRRSRC